MYSQQTIRSRASLFSFSLLLLCSRPVYGRTDGRTGRAVFLLYAIAKMDSQRVCIEKWRCFSSSVGREYRFGCGQREREGGLPFLRADACARAARLRTAGSFRPVKLALNNFRPYILFSFFFCLPLLFFVCKWVFFSWHPNGYLIFRLLPNDALFVSSFPSSFFPSKHLHGHDKSLLKHSFPLVFTWIDYIQVEEDKGDKRHTGLR